MSDVVQEANVALQQRLLLMTEARSGRTFFEQEVRQAVEAALEEQKTEAEIEENMAARVNVLQTVIPGNGKRAGERGNGDRTG